MTREEMFQDIESMTVGLDDTFKFHCDQCGKCCTHRDDIILSPMDIFKMARELKISPVDFYHQYCVFHIGDNSRTPFRSCWSCAGSCHAVSCAISCSRRNRPEIPNPFRNGWVVLLHKSFVSTVRQDLMERAFPGGVSFLQVRKRISCWSLTVDQVKRMPRV